MARDRTQTFKGFLDALDHAARERPDDPLIAGVGGTATRRQVDLQSRRIADGLWACGVRSGDRVATQLDSGLAAVCTAYALARIGAIWTPLDPAEKPDAQAAALQRTAARLALIDTRHGDAFATWAQDPAHRLVAVQGAADIDGLASGLGEGPLSRPDALASPDQPFMLIPTSGTTGRPKLAVVTHRMMQLAGQAVITAADVAPGDRLFVWEPLHHLGGAQLLAVIALSETSLWLAGGFDPGRFWTELARSEASHIHYLGGILQILAAQPPTVTDRAHKARVAWGAGANLALAGIFRDRFGLPLHEVYGLTESASISTLSTGGYDGSVGREAAWAEVRIEDESGAAQPPGASGEIVIYERGAPYFAGYFEDAEATARVFRNGGLHTGDRGQILADGRLVYEGRLTDVFRCRGEIVSALDVERIAAQHPDIEDCALTATPGDLGDQDLVLTLTSRGGIAVDPRAMSDWLAARLSPAQTPRFYRHIEAFPRTPSLRIQKTALPAGAAGAFDRFAALGADESRGELIEVVRHAWRRVLTARPDDNQSFADAGGDSLGFLRMCALVTAATGLRPPLAECGLDMTLQTFVARLRDLAPAPDPSACVLLPGVGGDSPLLADFRVRQDPSPLWLTLDYPDWRRIVLDRIESRDLLAILRERIDRAGLAEPIRLAGYSSGAQLAFALAVGLKADGRAVAPVLLLDSVAPETRPAPPVERGSTHGPRLDVYRHQRAAHPIQYIFNRLWLAGANRIVSWAWRKRRTGWMRSLARTPWPALPLNLDIRLEERLRIGFHTQLAVGAARDAIRQGPAPEAVLVASASHPVGSPADLGWGHAARLSHVFALDCDHFEILHPPQDEATRAARAAAHGPLARGD